MIKADKNYGSFEMVFECQPFVHNVYDKFKGQVCDHCLAKNDGLKRCSVCKHMYYCDRNCQRNDWRAGHRYECQIFKNHYKKLMIVNDSKPLLRLYLMKKADPQIFNKMYDTIGGQQRCFNDLMSHREDIVRDIRRYLIIQEIHYWISSCGVELPVNDLIDLYGKYVINAYETYVYNHLNGSTYICGDGLFIGASVLDHSCAYNVYFKSVGNKLAIMSATYITAGDKLAVSYINDKLIEKSTDIRRMVLKSQYYFDCHCRRCDDQ